MKLWIYFFPYESYITWILVLFSFNMTADSVYGCHICLLYCHRTVNRVTKARNMQTLQPVKNRLQQRRPKERYFGNTLDNYQDESSSTASINESDKISFFKYNYAYLISTSSNLTRKSCDIWLRIWNSNGQENIVYLNIVGS